MSGHSYWSFFFVSSSCCWSFLCFKYITAALVQFVIISLSLKPFTMCFIRILQKLLINSVPWNRLVSEWRMERFSYRSDFSLTSAEFNEIRVTFYYYWYILLLLCHVEFLFSLSKRLISNQKNDMHLFFLNVVWCYVTMQDFWDLLPSSGDLNATLLDLPSKHESPSLEFGVCVLGSVC